MNVVPVILAGGIGERFWPMSRTSLPKQLLKLGSKKTMIEETILRVKSLATKGVKPLIITSKQIEEKIKEALPASLPFDSIAEPVGKNTAPAVAIGAAWCQKMYGDSVMVVVSADHDVSPVQDFVKAAKIAIDSAKNHDELVVFGIKPTRPETGYGYLEIGEKLRSKDTINNYKVKKFIEKPTSKKATEYLKKGNFFWNSGSFVWKTDVILNEFKEYMPKLYDLAMTVERKGFSKAAINTFYTSCEKESVDYGIMERSSRVSVVVGNFTWDDIGSWESIPRLFGKSKSGVTTVGNSIYESECKDSVIVNKSPYQIASVGIENAVIAVTDDAILIIDRNKVPNIKKYLSEMKSNPKIPSSLF